MSTDPCGKLSELEACVLGLVWSEGPCTPYHVQRALAASPSPHWSGSAGAIYPVFRRLEARKLIQAKEIRQGRRAGKECRLTEAGRQALRAWLGPPLPEWITDLPIDPLRTRLRFLGALPPKRRAAWLDEARDAVRGGIQRIEADCRRLKKLDDPFPYAMARGALHLARARITWLDEVARSL
jgi:DNA-binding PadR family transcriptional regulator